MGQEALRQRVGGARASPIEQDQPGERCQRAQEQGEPGVLPGDVDVAEAEGGHDQVGWPLAEHLVGDPVVAQSGVPRLRLHSPSSRSRPWRHSRPRPTRYRLAHAAMG
jgi:hypothetical protein